MLLCFLYTFCCFLCPAWALDAPFWQSKKPIYDRIKKERYIAVSVTSKEISADPELYELKMSGGGWMSVPRDYAFLAATQYENLSRVSDYVKEAKYNAQAHELSIHFVAFGYHALVTFLMQEEKKGEDQFLNWEVVRGVFPGMKGFLRFSQAKNGRTEVEIFGTHRYSQWPIPKIFLEFGIEVALQKFSSSLRTFVEADFKSGVKYPRSSGGKKNGS